MPRLRKHIHRPSPVSLIPHLLKHAQISCQRIWSTGHINYRLRFHRCHGLNKRLGASGSWRVHEDDIYGVAGCGHLHHEFGSVVAVEAYVFDIITFGVLNSVADGVSIQFYADDFFGFGCGNDADGADSAVGIQYSLIAGQTGQFDGFAVQVLGLDRVDLVEGFRGDAEFAAAQFVLDIAFAVQNVFFIAQYHAGTAVVDVLDNGGDLRVLLAQGFDEVVLGREYRGCGDQHDHDLAAGETAADQDMA